MPLTQSEALTCPGINPSPPLPPGLTVPSASAVHADSSHVVATETVSASSPVAAPETEFGAETAEHTTTARADLRAKRPKRARVPSIAPVNRHLMKTRGKNKIFKPRVKMTLVAVAKNKAKSFTDIEPNTYQQALKDPNWNGGMSEEFDSLLQHHTWDLTPRPKDHNVVGCRWVFRLKRLPNGAIHRYKARLVAKGFHQRPGIDYFDTFSPVIKPPSIRLVLSLAVSRNWTLRQLDVNNAFLQGHLQELVYMEQPPGFIDSEQPDHVCKLNKAIYGLKQAPRAWYNELLYVDDIIITGNCSTRVQKFIELLGERFSLKDQGPLSYFLGLEVYRTAAGLKVTQTKYINDLLRRVNMLDAKSVATPMADKPPLTKRCGTSLTDPTEYRMVIGSLQYLLLTRPDVAFAVNKLAQFMECPSTEHWSAAKRVLRYLCGTRDRGLFFSADNPTYLHAYSDADWAGDKDDYTSTGAYLVYLGKHLISWSSKKQPTVARSSTEAEYRSVSFTASEVQWIQSLLGELGVSLSKTPVIYCDNVGATYLCANPVFHSRMKHLAVDYHYIRGLVQSGSLRVAHVSSADQLADGLTKPLPRTRFMTLTNKIGLSYARPS
ncbi:hypothetical protein AALP_AA7G135900 [Arabis alpina]|uniref:Reverse transcriptase Ty1/copia-type domain-containing protein n=1 Tax=Arabis alpina TaxID=50452 RepID=A0A087GHU7_ARAAL|nr:hypothetical protein AALP_AA7G135900 [Arabis alpina]